MARSCATSWSSASGIGLMRLPFLALLCTGLFLFFWPLAPLASVSSRLIHRIAAIVLLAPYILLSADRRDFLRLLKVSLHVPARRFDLVPESAAYFVGLAKGCRSGRGQCRGQRVHHALTIIFYNLVAGSGLLMWLGVQHIPGQVFLSALVVHDISMAVLTVLMLDISISLLSMARWMGCSRERSPVCTHRSSTALVAGIGSRGRGSKGMRTDA